MPGSNGDGRADRFDTVSDAWGCGHYHEFALGSKFDAAGNLWVADAGNNEIKIVSPAGVVSILAGNENSGATDGTGSAASFNNPSGVAVDAAGNVYVADLLNNLIRKITPAGVVSVLAQPAMRSTNSRTAVLRSASRNGQVIRRSCMFWLFDGTRLHPAAPVIAGSVITLAFIVHWAAISTVWFLPRILFRLFHVENPPPTA